MDKTSPATPALSPGKRIVFSFVAILLFLIFFAAFAEVMFRLTRGAPNPLFETTQKAKTTLFEPGVPKEGKSGQHDEFAYTAHINRFGFRGYEFAMPKPPGQVRVFAVGDSFTYGVGAEDEETIPAVLEAALRKTHPQIEVVNAGIGHASPIQHLVNFKNIFLQYEPDVVVLLLDMTDIQDDWRNERMAVRNSAGEITGFDPVFVDGKRSLWRTLVHYSAFAKYLEQKVVRSWEKMALLGFKTYMQTKREGERAKSLIVNAPEGAYPDQVILDFDGLLMLRGRARERLIRQQFERTSKYILQIRDLLKEKNIPMILVMYPHGIYVGKDEWSQGRLTWGFEPDKQYDDHFPFELVEAFAAAHQIPFVNTLPDFLTAPAGDYFYEWDGHMRPAGYKLVGQSIARDPQLLDAINR